MTVHHHCVALRWWPGDYSLILFSSALCILTMFDILIGTHTIFVHCNGGISPSFPPVNSPLIPHHPVIADCLHICCNHGIPCHRLCCSCLNKYPSQSSHV